MLAIIQLPDIFSQVGSSNTRVTLNIHVVTKGQDNLLDLNCQLSSWRQAQNLQNKLKHFISSLSLMSNLSLPDCGINALENSTGEGRSFTGSRLCLGDNITTLHDGLDGSLLDGGRFLKTIRVNTPEKIEFFTICGLKPFDIFYLSKSSLKPMESKVGITSTSSDVSNSTLAKSSSTCLRLAFEAIFNVNLKKEDS